MNSFAVPSKPSSEIIKYSKEWWMMAYPMTSAEAQKLVDNPPPKIPDSQEPFHDSPEGL